jgi:putative NIF3 family GTP cyclohydrolase 1 type 2
MLILAHLAEGPRIVCAGAGSSVLKDVEADLYWTGEMSHVGSLTSLFDIHY